MELIKHLLDFILHIDQYLSSWVTTYQTWTYLFLFAIIFLFIHRLTIKIHRLESENRLLIQETSLLKHSLSSDRAK